MDRLNLTDHDYDIVLAALNRDRQLRVDADKTVQLAARWQRWADGVGPKPVAQRTTKRRHRATDRLATTDARPSGGYAVKSLTDRARDGLARLAEAARRDPEPSQHFDPAEHFAWAARASRRRQERDEWEALLP